MDIFFVIFKDITHTQTMNHYYKILKYFFNIYSFIYNNIL